MHNPCLGCAGGSPADPLPPAASRPHRRKLLLALPVLLLLTAAQAAAATFEPDEAITSIDVKVHTADVSLAGTDDDVYVELFDWPAGVPKPLPWLIWSVEIDSPANDFERNSTRTYSLPSWYFAGRIVNDIDRVCIRKSSDGLFGGWALGYVTVYVNGKELYTSLDVNNPGAYVWLEDDHRTWCASNFVRVPFTAPTIVTLGLPDAGPGKAYKVPLTAVGGRKPLTWSIVSGSGDAFVSPPTLVAQPGNTDHTVMLFTGQTTSTVGTAGWSGTLGVQDAEGRYTQRTLSMRVIDTLPPPTLHSFTPALGWPATPPAVPKPVRVTLTGANFDSRKPDATKVFFQGPGTTRLQAKVLEVTGTQAIAEVPAGAVSGKLSVRTASGEALSAGSFIAHPHGYRFTDGFAFVNRPSDFAGTFAWERYEQTFGICEMWICVFGVTTIPNPVSAIFFAATRDVIDNGLCHGMSLTSLQMRKGILTTTGFPRQDLPYPVDGTLWELQGTGGPSTSLSNWIQSRQLVTMSDEGLSYYLNRLDNLPTVQGDSCHMDARPALADMSQALSAGLNDPRMLAFAKGCSVFTGHVVVPYALESSGGQQLIRVWDPNRPAQLGNPDDQKSYFSVNPATGRWTYDWGGGDIWQGEYMFTIPLSAYGHQEHWCLPGAGAALAAIDWLFGCAVVGGGEIVQVTDSAGRQLFTADGSVTPERSLRPEVVRLIPLFGPEGRKPGMLALVRDEPITVEVRPTSRVGEEGSTFLAALRGPDLSLSVEDITAPLRVGLDLKRQAVSLEPVRGRASGILRLTRRYRDKSESLAYAVRLHDLEMGKPVSLKAGPLEDTVDVSAGNAPLRLDLEVTHTSRIGETRILESDGIQAPAGSVARFRVEHPETLDLQGAEPVLLELITPGSSQPIRQYLGQKVDGPAVANLPRQVMLSPTPPQDASISVDATQTLTGASSSGLTFRSLSGPSILDQQNGLLRLPLTAGTQVVRLEAMDRLGRRSFPRMVFLTAPEGYEDENPRSPTTFFGEDTTAMPGTNAVIPVGVHFADAPADRVEVDLSVRQRLSGRGRAWPRFGEASFQLSPALQRVGASVSTELGADGQSLRVSVSWDQAYATPGRMDLGTLTVQVPAGVPLGSTFILRGVGTASTGDQRVRVTRPLTVLPTALKVWGGPEPASLEIVAPKEVDEEAEISMEAKTRRLSEEPLSAGWWVEPMGGRALVVPDAQNPLLATLKGQRAGLVRVRAVVGTKTADAYVLVKATVSPSLQMVGPLMPELRQYPLPELVRGDPNRDGRTSVADVLVSLRFAIKLAVPTPDELEQADLDQDGIITIADVVLTLRQALGLELPPRG